MKYKNAVEILPAELVEEIQKYVQGEFLYVPKKERKAYRADTEYKTELAKRNARVFKMHLEGMSNARLAENFSLAQSSIRRILIAERKRFELMSGKIKDLLPTWGLDGESITQIYGTVWQIGEDYVLKSYNEPEALKRNISVNSHLENMGIPVGGLLFTKNGEQYVEEDGWYFYVARKLQGSNIVSLKFGNRIGEAMGEIIAKLHLAFDSLQHKVDIWNNSLLDEMKGWVKESFEQSGFRNISSDEYDSVVNNLENLYWGLSTGLIHRDVHFGNFLFNKGVFSGYIDFDLSQKNIRVFDLCYFVLSVLSEKEKFEITEEKWFEFVKNVFAGYNKIIALTSEEKASAVYVMECIELLFLAYFEGQDDSALAQKTYSVFKFISSNERRITKTIR
ncbi:MAG: phosphotransferase [Clostridia bacterium]|nr:phosphotransferase [Clostridia bacterium]